MVKEEMIVLLLARLDVLAESMYDEFYSRKGIDNVLDDIDDEITDGLIDCLKNRATKWITESLSDDHAGG